MKHYKTTGLEWLLYSLAAFNGSGYANKSTPEEYLQSYIDYSAYKKKTQVPRLIEEYYQEAFDRSAELCHSRDAGRTPSDKRLRRFEDWKRKRDSDLPLL